MLGLGLNAQLRSHQVDRHWHEWWNLGRADVRLGVSCNIINILRNLLFTRLLVTEQRLPVVMVLYHSIAQSRALLSTAFVDLSGLGALGRLSSCRADSTLAHVFQESFQLELRLVPAIFSLLPCDELFNLIFDTHGSLV